MTQRTLRQKPRISYFEPEEPDLDEYVFCEKCGDYVYEYCSIHGPLLIIPDDKVPAKPNVPSYVPRAALTIPHVFLHITYSIIPDAGLGVFASMALPSGVRFGPYRGQRTDFVDSSYCWQIYDKDRKPLHCIDAGDANKSNWMRYVNCARHWREQNLVAYQFQGELYYRTIKIIPRFTELMVFYGSEFTCELDVDLGKYNSPAGYAQKFGAIAAKKRKPNDNNTKNPEDYQIGDEATTTNIPTTNQDTVKDGTGKDIPTKTIKEKGILNSNGPEDIKSIDGQSDKFIKIAGTKAQTKNKKATKSIMITEGNRGDQTKPCKKKANKTSVLKTNSHNIEITENKNNITITNNMPNSKVSLGTANTNVLDLYIYCGDCNKKCITKLELQKHLRFHDLNRTYACEVCKFRFTTLLNLKSHMNFVHIKTQRKCYTCEICDKKISNYSYLKTHMRTHTGEKPYACEICDKKFCQNGHLERHMRTHTGEKPYACEICDKKFCQNGHLEGHLRTHTGEKPYACEICDKKFFQNGNLKTHMRTHTGEKPYACEICDKKFCQNGHLEGHLRTHTGEKPYACEICDKKFFQNGNLKTHMRTHTGEKPYACEICDKTFSHNISLKTHLRTHMREKP